MADDVSIVFSVNGKDLKPIKMPPFTQDNLYKRDLMSYFQGHVMSNDGTLALYDFNLRISRRKTLKEEKGHEDKG